MIAIENARLLSELRESLERQTATSEVLGVISRSKFELQPILQSVVDTAERLCHAEQTVIYRLQDGVYRFAAGHSAVAAYLELERNTVISPGPGTVVGRAAMTRQIARIEDAWNDPLYENKEDAKVGGVRSMIGVPLMRDGEPIGVIGLARCRVEPFSDREIELVKTFADQAVIAIENVRLFEAEQQRTRELTESLEQQTATSEVLSVISSSPGDLQPVFDRLLTNATRLCEANFGLLVLYQGDGRFRVVAMHNAPPAFAKLRQREPEFYASPKTGLGRTAATKEVVHIADYAEEEAYKRRDPAAVALGELGGARTFLVVPMLKDNEMVGAIAIYRQQVRPFSDKQIALVANFAAQAVIAIENTRLLNELRQRTTDLTESLEQQTATSDVLQVISSSPGELQPVFHAMLQNAARVCDAKFGMLFRLDDGAIRPVASVGVPAPLMEYFESGPRLPSEDAPIMRAAATKRPVHVVDFANERPYQTRNPLAVAAVERFGVRTLLVVPLLKEGEFIGAFAIFRQEVRPFTEKQIELLQNFASQAVIAIENTRLLTELRQRTADLTESLEQQTATSEVLRVISSSPGELEPVFQAMLTNAVRMCGAVFGMLYRYDGRSFSLATHIGAGRRLLDLMHGPIDPHPDTILGRVLATNNIVEIEDATKDQAYLNRNPVFIAGVEEDGTRGLLGVPMLQENMLVGAFVVFRQEVGPFTEKQIKLVQNFAAQAVIAIENARLLNELRESLERQTATAEVLSVISRSPGDLSPVFESILQNATRICDANFANLELNENGTFRIGAMYNAPAAFAEQRQRAPMIRPHPKGVIAHIIATKQAFQCADLLEHPAYKEGAPGFVDLVEKARARTLLGVPLLKEDEVVGVFGIYRQEVRPFGDKQIELVKNFAAQAVIAIENTRLLTELRQRTDDLTDRWSSRRRHRRCLRSSQARPAILSRYLLRMLENAVRICDASLEISTAGDGDVAHPGVA